MAISAGLIKSHPVVKYALSLPRKRVLKSLFSKKRSLVQLIIHVVGFGLLKIGLELIVFHDSPTERAPQIPLDKPNLEVGYELSRYWKGILFKTLRFRSANTPELDPDLIHFVRSLIRWPNNLFKWVGVVLNV